MGKPDFYFISNKQNNKTQEANNANFVFKKEELQGFKDILNKLSIEIEVHDFIKYLKKAIQARESTKFDFTRNLSVALDLMIKYGIEELGLSREDVGYLTFDDFQNIKKKQLSKKTIVSVVKLRKIDFSEKHLAKLPSFISDEKDFFGYEQGKSEANYVTILNVVADLSFIKSDHADNIKGKIVAIPNADPGLIGSFLIILQDW